MKWLIIVLLILFTQTVFSQNKFISFHSANKRQKNLQGNCPDSLAKYLTENSTTDIEKVTSIFLWITDNIAYHVISYNKPYNNSAFFWDEDDDTSAELKPLDERVAEMVLKKRLAVCDGYARLFKTLCNDAGIKSEVITGYARTNGNSQFRCNHKWNAVMIDSNWYLLDATWASGYINYNNEFVKDYDERYFLTPPKDFIEDHYPENFQWTLLQNPSTLREFYRTPFKGSAYNTYNILSYKPSNGIINANVGDTIVFELQTNDAQKKLWIIDSAYEDSSLALQAIFSDSLKPICTVNNNKVSCAYIVISANVQWLNVMYNNEFLMRYKLNIKKIITEKNNLATIKQTIFQITSPTEKSLQK
ncbi:MAG: transglutaminase domain-containing protein [Chitinophagaceae bacterium]